MNPSSDNCFTYEQQRFAELAKALSHPARLAILEILASKEECMCGNIATILPLAQSTVSQHLSTLKKTNLIKGKITGLSICYDINPEVLYECCALFDSFSKKMLSPEKN